MFCTKCGYKLRDDDLFCGNCGAKINAEAPQGHAASSAVETSSTQDVKSAADEKTNVSSHVQVVRQVPGKGLRKDLKLPAKRKVILQKPQLSSVNGSKSSASAEGCPSSGAEGGRIAPAKRPVSTADVVHAAKISKSLEKRPLPSYNGAEVITGFFVSWYFWPIYALNPLFWFASHYKSKAKDALVDGDVSSAQKLKEKSTKFAVGGWVLTVVVIALVWVAKK